MTTQDIENFATDVKKVIEDWFVNSGFKARKLTDTPTDDLQVVNKKYVDNNSSGSGSIVRAFLGTNLAATASPSWGVVVFNTSSFDTNSEYNTGNGQFTAKTAGYYRVSYQIAIQAGGGSSWSANDFFDTRITVNTVELSYARNDMGTTTIGPVFSRFDIVHLAIGDSVRVENKAQGSGVIMASGDQTFLNIHSL